jgi:CDP-glycerol glycerophosphotransferase
VRELRAEQAGTTLLLTFVLHPRAIATALWARDTVTDTWHRVSAVAPLADGRYDVIVDLGDLPTPAGDQGARFALAVELTEVLPDGQRRRIALGRAQRTEVGPMRLVRLAGPDGERTAIPYPNSAGGISIALDRPLDPYGVVHVHRLAVKHGELHLRGRLGTRHGDLHTAHLVLNARVGGGRLERKVTAHFDAERSQRRFGHRWYAFDVRVDCRSLLRPPHSDDDIYDAWFRIATEQHPEPFELRVGRTRLLTRYRTRPGWARSGDRAVAINPYYTFKAKRTSLNVNHFDARTATYLRIMRRLRHVDRLLHAGRQTWLIGERPRRAQDNGYWFFRYLREHHPDLPAYYVIAPDSPERARVEPFGNVVEFGSRQHIRLALRATKIVGTHHPDFLYPMRTRQFARAVRAQRVFLQHGVMGTKWMANFYGRAAVGFDTDLVVVSSEREKECLVGDFGYDPEEVVVTGLPRFDSLFAGDVATNPRQLLVMPTWRDWLLHAERYRESEFHETWSQFLHDPRLRRLADEGGLEILFCLHPNMEQFREMFADAPVRLMAAGEVDVQMLLKQSAMLVTDYSSVGFDFAFLDKPVAYFQFDRRAFLGALGSHLELDEELPGPVFRSVDGTIGEVTRRLSAGFSMEKKYRERADRFIAHRDRHSCDRVYDAVSAARPRHRIRRRLARSEILAVLPKAFRRSRFYFPAMRRMFALLTRLPADKALVVFESGLGKQYADSPRYLYEELVRQRPDMKKVWIHNGRLRTSDPHTVVVRRLSVRYFYYLARAKYWINNQSFPHYLVRRPHGVFVQTWHGTPLKRMLHDLPEVHGRDTGYVERATRGAQQWSVLVSPNAYTSEHMRTAFRYEGPILEVGYPRNDVLHAPDLEQLRARVRARLGLPPDKRVVLYAPTFRDDQVRRGGFSFELPLDLDRMHAALGADMVLLMRMHLLVAKAVAVPPHLRDFARDVSGYSEIQELIVAADALVTDYSSVFFDYAQLRRPTIFYAYDLGSYRDRLRGFYLDYDNDLPGPIVETEEALIDALADLDAVAEKYAHQVDSFVERFAPHDDGHAAERVVRHIFELDTKDARPGPLRSPRGRAGSRARAR